MYLAKMDDSLCKAKYYYKDNSIYFNIDFSLSDVQDFALHECLHALQQVKDSRGNLVRLGLYDFAGNHGNAINEAAVQLMTSCAINSPSQEATYYNLSLNSNSLDCYPLECAIVKQMSYFTGTYPLFHSTLTGDNVFKNTFIAISNKKCYNLIEANLDKILDLENNLSLYFHELKASDCNEKEISHINTMIEKTKEKITALFLECQNSIITECISTSMNNIRLMSDVKDLKEKIYNFKDYIATTPSYTFYNDFYRKTMANLEIKAAYIQEHGPFDIPSDSSLALSVVSNTKGVFAIFKRIARLLGLAKEIN